jgi:hypothetical protein
MMKTDTSATACEAAARAADPKLTAFHDPHHFLGRAMARRLGWRYHVAWDAYFVYRPGVRWTDQELPVPDGWAHQLQDREVWEQTAEAEFGTSAWTEALPKTSEADPAHFATGHDLLVMLTSAITQCSSPVSPAPPLRTIPRQA